MTTLRTACPLDCPDGCTLEVEVTDGRLISVGAPAADASDPTISPLSSVHASTVAIHRGRLSMSSVALVVMRNG